MKRFVILLLVMSLFCLFLSACSEQDPDPGLANTETFRDTAEVVRTYHKSSDEDNPAKHQLILKYRYTEYTIDVTHELEQSTEAGSSKDVMVTQKCYNYGVDKWSIVLADE